MSATDRIKKLEALLDRVRRNKTDAPVRAVSAAEPMALDALPPQTQPLGAAPSPAPPPVAAARVPLTPPAPQVTPSPATVESAQPAPPTAPPPAPPIATAPFQPEPGSAVQPRPSEPPMEIGDDDLLEVTTIPPEAEVSGTVNVSEATRSTPPEEIDASDLEDEQAPVSSSRFKVPSTLDEALANAAESEGEREIPAQTPPPESGPQEALPATGLEAPRLPDVHQLEADLDGPPSLGPTAEQLGETIELEAPRGPELEIDVAVVTEAEPAVTEQPEELEVTLPRASLPSGLYDVNLSAAPPEPMVTAPSPAAPTGEIPIVTMPAPSAAVTVPAQAGTEGPTRTVARPAIGATDVAQVTLVPPSSARSFIELLDASLGV